MAVTGFKGLLFPEASGRFRLPLAAYYITKTARTLTPLFLWLSTLESRVTRRRTSQLAVERPIYICGLARAGTTVVLEILSRHPDVACHRYIHMPMPYLPYWWGAAAPKGQLGKPQPVERLHGDGVMVTRYSPEAVEEALWLAFFNRLHDEEHSNILDASVSNKAFEIFYRDHILKLLASQNGVRYVAKNNYNVSRLEYLLRIFPDARFLLVVRDPAGHLASLIRQNRIFESVENTNPKMANLIQLIGHYEFGKHRVCINVGDTSVVHEIRKLWSEGKDIQGWATYWAAIYGFVADRLECNIELAHATLVVRYEDLTHDSSQTLERIIDHVGLSAELFAPVRRHYISELRERRQYPQELSSQELADIAEYIGPTARRFGYF